VGNPPAGGIFLPGKRQEATMSNSVVFYCNDEIEEMVRRFEACDFERGEFTHAFHLAVAAWYVSTYPEDEALTRMRSGLLRLTNKFGVKAYHETITQFWMRISRDFLALENTGTLLADSVNRLIAAFCKTDVIYEYYSRELLESDSAKGNWMEPDLKPISTGV